MLFERGIDMKITIDTKKGKEALSKALQKTSEVSKKAVDDIQQSAKEFSEKQKQEAYLKRLEKYNPLFIDEYKSEEFVVPNIIIFVDEGDRKNVDVCQGAIGWKHNENNTDMLFLYNNGLELNEYQFYPAKTDGVFVVDSFDKNRYIRVDMVFSKAHEERMAELKQVAYSLGAKNCSIEITESNVEVQTDKNSKGMKIGLPKKLGNVGNQNEALTTNASSIKRTGKIVAEFDGNNEPVQPNLKWFANDDNIKNLIEMRLSKGNSIKSEIIELAGSSSATMTQKTACAIDGALNKFVSAKVSSNIEKQAQREQNSTLLFIVEF